MANGDEDCTRTTGEAAVSSQQQPEAANVPANTSTRKNKRRRDRVRLQEGSRIREPGADPEMEPLARSTSQAPSEASKSGMTVLGLGSAFDLVRRVSDKMSNKKQEHPLKRRASRRARAGSVRRTSSRNKRQNSVRSGSQSSAPGTISRWPNGQPSRRLVLDTSGNIVTKKQDSSDDQKGDVETGEGLIGKPEKTVKDQVFGIISNGWRQFQIMIGAKPEEVITVQEIIKEPILEDLDLPHRYRPENLQLLCDATGFSVVEMKRIYRGFKTECPTGLITEEAFHGIYSRFFPQGAQFVWKDSGGKIRSSVKPPNVKMTKKEKKEAQNSQGKIWQKKLYDDQRQKK